MKLSKTITARTIITMQIGLCYRPYTKYIQVKSLVEF